MPGTESCCSCFWPEKCHIFFLTSTQLKFFSVVTIVPGEYPYSLLTVKGLFKICFHSPISVLVMRDVPNGAETAADACLASGIFGAAVVAGQCAAAQTYSWCSPEPKLLPLPGTQLAAMDRGSSAHSFCTRPLLSPLALFRFSNMLILGGVF